MNKARIEKLKFFLFGCGFALFFISVTIFIYSFIYQEEKEDKGLSIEEAQMAYIKGIEETNDLQETMKTIIYVDKSKLPQLLDPWGQYFQHKTVNCDKYFSLGKDKIAETDDDVIHYACEKTKSSERK